MKILVTGGSGYIGGFMIRRLLEDQHEVVNFDKNIAADSSGAESNQGNLLDKEQLEALFKAHKFDAVIHFAADISMGESMRDPHKYFENNTYGSLQLIEQAVNHDIHNFIFSSTAGVYGNPEKTPIPEDHPKNPTNPYGQSKLMTEQILGWYNHVKGFNSISLRYFNACGAALDGSRGEKHLPETHIIPSAISALSEHREFKLYGTDYETPDGTAIRDYIHVLDLVDAHVLALNRLKEGVPGALAYNVGTGKGHSNREVVKMIEEVSGQTLNIVEEPRRAGDADVLVADATRIKSELGFEPKYSDLRTIIDSAWKWHTYKQ